MTAARKKAVAKEAVALPSVRALEWAKLIEAAEADPVLRERLFALLNPPRRGAVITTSTGAAAHLRAWLDGRRDEALVGVFLDRRRKIIETRVLTRGCDAFCIVDTKQIFRVAVEVGAHALLLAHNHPSGDAEPSVQDRDVTQRVASAGRAIGIALLDHIIMTDDDHVSLAERGELPAYARDGVGHTG